MALIYISFTYSIWSALRVEYQQLYQIINAIGEASSFAQGLNNIITNAEKLQNSDHLLYLMKEDDEASWVGGEGMGW